MCEESVKGECEVLKGKECVVCEVSVRVESEAGGSVRCVKKLGV